MAGAEATIEVLRAASVKAAPSIMMIETVGLLLLVLNTETLAQSEPHVVLYGGWYAVDGDFSDSEVRARIYGEYEYGSHSIRGRNVVTYTCKQRYFPYITINIPPHISHYIKMAKEDSSFSFSDYVTVKSKTKLMKYRAWYEGDDSDSKFVIEQQGADRGSIERFWDLISALTSDFEIDFFTAAYPRYPFNMPIAIVQR